MLLAWLKKNLIASIAASLLIALLVGAVVMEGKALQAQAVKLGAAQSSVKSVTGERDDALLELASVKAAQKTLTAAHETCLNEVKVASKEQAVSSQQIADLVKKVESSGAVVRSYRDKLYLEPNCDALKQFDLASACPALADSVRHRARALASPAD
jgi:hypothetical protein